jgi:transposase
MVKRRKYSPDFKRGTVEQARQPGVSCAQVARELGIGANLPTRLKRAAHGEGTRAFGGTGNARDEEVTQLKRELSRVKKARVFLGGAATSLPRNRPEVSGDQTWPR